MYITQLFYYYKTSKNIAVEQLIYQTLQQIADILAERKSINNCIAENDLLREVMRSGGNFHFQKGYKKAEKNHPKTICQHQICLVFSDISPSLYFGTN